MNEQARELWLEKLEFLLAEEAKAVDPAMKFRLIHQIAEARAKLMELGGPTGNRVLGPLISPTRLRYPAPRLFGRDDELALLDQAWEDERTNIVSFVAWGGVGKTSLVAEWMSRLAADGWRGTERVFDWSFYNQGTRHDREGSTPASADLFMAEALRFFGDPEPQQKSPWDRGARLARVVGQSRSLLVLDGLEPLQYPPGPQEGTLTDSGLSALLKGLAGRNAGLCVLTTRQPVADLSVFAGPGKTVLDRRLDRLSDKAGAALLRSFGVVGPERELETASREVAGHALTLHLMGRYLALAHHGDIRRLDLFGFAEADSQVQGGHAFRVLAAYEDWLVGEGINQKLSDSTNSAMDGGAKILAMLRLMGLFDRQADPGCLAALRAAPTIAGLTDSFAGWTDEQWNIAVKRLEELGLLSRSIFEQALLKGHDEQVARARLDSNSLNSRPPEPQPFTPPGVVQGESLDAHPLLREYFGEQVRLRFPAAWQAGHQRLFEYLSGSVPYWPEGIEGIQPLYQAISHGCLAGLHEQALSEIYDKRIQRGSGDGGFYSSKELGLAGANLGALAYFFERPWAIPLPNLSASDQAWLLNEAGFYLQRLGRLSEAVTALRAGIEMAVEQGDWGNAAIYSDNLSELELKRGGVAVAAAVGEQAVTFADRGEDAFWQRAASRSTQADALHQGGQRHEAQRLFEDAEARQAASQPKYPQLYSLQGFHYCDFLLADAERSAWQRGLLKRPDADALLTASITAACDAVSERAAYALAGAERHRLLLDAAMDHLTLARAILYKANSTILVPPTAFKHVTAAVEGFHKSNSIDELPRGLLTRAWLLCLSGDEAGCRADLDEAWEIAERGPMPLFQADIQLYRARLFRDRAALEEARRLIEKHGYRRRDGELADAIEAAKGW